MTKYEMVVVLDPNKTEEEQQTVLAKLDEVITKNGGTIESRDVWGKRRLAYSIGKRRDGYYVLYLFDADPSGSALPELNRYLRISEDVLRSLVTKAVVGKSTGKAPSEMEGHGPYRGRPSFGRDRDSRPDREYRRPSNSDSNSSDTSESADAEKKEEAPASTESAS
ncbi:30S ribosomal protein S6 [bacterium]|nr:30S ribosomal protein S6 [bacterium]